MVKLGGRLKDYLPTAKGGAIEWHLETGTGLTEIIEQLRLREDTDRLLVIVDGENVPPSRRADYTLQSGQLIHIMSPLKGG